MFEAIEPTVSDPIFGLKEAFERDPSTLKVDLVEGVYKDEEGRTPILAVVKEAERRILKDERSKSYLGIIGSPAFGAPVRRLLFGAAHELDATGRAASAQCPGGTGALRVAAELVARLSPNARVWLSRPTWENHGQVFAGARLGLESYGYFDPDSNDLAFDRMVDDLGAARRDDVVVLHGCCHNPTGVDLSVEQWATLGDEFERRGVMPLIDIAYQGFGSGVEDDAAGLRVLAERVGELLVCCSFSKNFGVYRERVGALNVVARDRNACSTVMTHVKRAIRGLYSNPPDHGAAIVRTVLDDDELRGRWRGELEAMRARIARMRVLFAEGLMARGTERDFAFMSRQKGLFSFAGLSPEQVVALREKHSIYVVSTGRVNVAGLTEGNIGRVCDAIVDVLG